MAGHKPFGALIAGLDRPRVEAKKTALRTRMTLAELRAARRMTQERLAETLQVKQPAVAKIEKRTDMYVGNLRRFVEAMGGELHITARFADGDVEIANFADLGEPVLEETGAA